jgi:transcriptional regulator with XRE-family HTH domain
MYNHQILKNLAHSRGVSNVEIGKLIEKSRVTVSNFMNGKAYPTIRDLEKIAKFFNVDVFYFFDEYEKKIIAAPDKNSAEMVRYLKALVDSQNRELENLRKFYDKFSEGAKK